MASQIAQTLKLNFKNHLCIFCGECPSTPDGDHIFARGFYPENQRTKADVVYRCPSCRPCQDTWHDSEQYLISLLPAALEAAHHPAAQQVLAGPVSRARAKGKGPARRVYEAARPINLISMNGLQIGIARETQLDAVRFQPACRKILWGLAYLHLGESLPKDLECRALSLDAASFRTELNRLHCLGAEYMHYDRNDVIGHMLYRNQNDPDEVECLVAFYPDLVYSRGVFFHVKTTSFRGEGTIIELKADLTVDQGSIQAGKYVIVERVAGVVTIASAGYDLVEHIYHAVPNTAIRINPVLLVEFGAHKPTLGARPL